MKTFALLQNDLLWSIIVAEEPPQWRETVFVDITEMSPRPRVGWYWTGAEFEAPETFESEQERQRILQTRRDVIAVQLKDIDVLSVRPLRAVASGAGDDFDRDKLQNLDAKATALRAELLTLV